MHILTPSALGGVGQATAEDEEETSRAHTLRSYTTWSSLSRRSVVARTRFQRPAITDPSAVGTLKNSHYFLHVYIPRDSSHLLSYLFPRVFQLVSQSVKKPSFASSTVDQVSLSLIPLCVETNLKFCLVSAFHP